MERRRRCHDAALVLLVAGISCNGGAPTVTAPVRAAFGLDARPANPTCLAAARPPSTLAVRSLRVYANVQLANAVVLTHIAGDRARWFVAERMGPGGGDARIVSFAADAPADEPAVVATLGPLADVGTQDGEGGLIGMAFHPRFADNGRLYVSWVRADAAAPNGDRSAVGWLTSRDGGAHFSDYRELFAFDQSSSPWHKGGGLRFGADGLLYAAFGDGGTADDMLANGQRRDGFFGKIHRVDVDHAAAGKLYAIPADNPFARGGGQATTFAWGLRNPFRFSIDRATNELWVGDVGADRYEEIDVVRAGGNYGWPCREGHHDYIAPPDPRCPSGAGLVDPVAELAHEGSTRAIVGGVVYRGKALPALVGDYIFGDFARRELWALEREPATGATTLTLLNEGGTPQAGWVDFAEDADGEIYALGMEGVIYKMVAAPPVASTFPDRLSRTGCVDPSDARVPAAGLVPYGVNAPLWSDGADKTRFFALPDDAGITVGDDGHLELPVGSVLVKNFRVAGRPVETRLFMRHDDGGWAGYSYEWLADGSDAVLLTSSKQTQVGDTSWHFPSRAECLLCHNSAAGQTLGLELGQLDGDFVYASTGRISNQLQTLEHIDLLAAPLGPRASAAFPDPLGGAPLAERARAYLHANCAMCHRPDGVGIVDMDLRFSRPLAVTHTCNVVPSESDLGVAGALRLAPGAPARSLVSLRPHATAAGRMPPLATAVVDDAGLAVVDAWIAALDGCVGR
jgi:uncharacterized repeat protein (TIGR03806 family)